MCVVHGIKVIKKINEMKRSHNLNSNPIFLFPLLYVRATISSIEINQQFQLSVCNVLRALFLFQTFIAALYNLPISDTYFDGTLSGFLLIRIIIVVVITPFCYKLFGSIGFEREKREKKKQNHDDELCRIQNDDANIY